MKDFKSEKNHSIGLRIAFIGLFMGPRRSKHRDGRPKQGNEIARKDGLQPRVDMARDPFTIHATLHPLNCPGRLRRDAICKGKSILI